MCLTSLANISLAMIGLVIWVGGTYSSSWSAWDLWETIWCTIHMWVGRRPRRRTWMYRPLLKEHWHCDLYNASFYLRLLLYLAAKSLAVMLTLPPTCPLRLSLTAIALSQFIISWFWLIWTIHLKCWRHNSISQMISCSCSRILWRLIKCYIKFYIVWKIWLIDWKSSRSL